MPSQPTEAEWHATLARTYGDAKATALIAAMKKAHPEKSIRSCPMACAALPGSQQRHAHGQAEVRPEGGRPVFAYLLHLAIADAGRRGRLAHGRARLLLRQHEALRAGHGQHAGGANAGEEDGHGLGEFRPHRQSQPARLDLGADRSGSAARRWYSTTNAAWWTIRKVRRGRL